MVVTRGNEDRGRMGEPLVLREFENRILRLIANGSSLEETAQALCLDAERVLPGVICSVMSVDSAGMLRTLAAPRLLDEYSSAMHGVMIGPDVGSCGAAAYLRVPVLVTDIAQDPNWTPFRDHLLGTGLQACWSSPLPGYDGKPAGVLALYFREARGPVDREMTFVSTCIDLWGIALRRHERVLDRERRASVDALTGLPNRSVFNAAIARLPCDQAGAWALLVIDLDNLKTVNDTFGHQVGDALIRVVATRIADAVLPDVSFRLGGDEFAVIVKRSGALSDLSTFVSTISEALACPADCEGHILMPTATIGGAVLSPGDLNPEVVYRNADFALYHAKETGRGGFVRYRPGIGTRMIHRRDVIRDVAVALAEGRIDSHYQPIVRLDTNEIVGIEALCRLLTPAGEVVSTATFKEATADAGVASELTSRMLSVVATDVRAWLDAGIPFQHVGLNVSTADFYTGNLLQKLERSFGVAGVPLGHLILEVKEDASMGRRDNVVSYEIQRLRKNGVRVALDSFGVGHASLTHLVGVPVDAIKIDRSFIARLWPDDPSMAIVQSLIDIARKLDIRIVAAGIETGVQASQLWTMGCRLGQGYSFSHPVDRVAMTTLLHRHAQGIEGAVPLLPREVSCHRVPIAVEQRIALAGAS
jgi:diguanylate cyclase (GGDEF)-like protein